MTIDEEFEEFAMTRTPQLHRSAWLLCGNLHGAEDLVQETLVKVYRRWRRIDNPGAYAQTTLVRTFLSLARSKSGQEIACAEVPDGVGVDPTDAADSRIEVQEVLAGLTPLDRSVLVLRFSDGLSVEDVAQRLGLSPGAVKNRSMRALRRARRRAER